MVDAIHDPENADDPTLRAPFVSLNSVVLVSAPSFGAMAIGLAAKRLGVQIPVLVAACFALLCLALLPRKVVRSASVMEATGD